MKRKDRAIGITFYLILTLIGFNCKKDEDSNICNPEQIDQLVAYYALDGNANDGSGHQNHGEITGPVPALDRKMNENSAYYFDGEDDIIQIEDNPQLYFSCEFTISAWIYPESIRSQEIIRKGSHVNGGYKWPFGLALSGTNDMIFSVTTENGVLTQARKPGYEKNTWYLITGVLKNEKMYLYINGELEVTEEINGTIVDDPLPLIIGTRLQLPSSTFKGMIDDVRIYNYALNDHQVMDLFNE